MGRPRSLRATSRVREMSGSKDRENRLASETSPYLRQHRFNPVDWYPWGEEAFSRARAEDKPVFLSVGYSSCHWCHVMERESFSDPEVAEVMNRDFVNVKVDREERPDVDEIYMAATQLWTHQGGWPNSVFLTPKLEPFFAGTYFPPTARHGRPAFVDVIRGLAEAWRHKRTEIEMQAEELSRVMRRYLEERGVAADEVPGSDLVVRAAAVLAEKFDADNGGFGSAPKFPTPANLLLLLELAEEDGDAERMLATTLGGMARGGIFDQLGGGFHRYSTDPVWLVPHFEKMLSDNGLLLEVFAEWFERTRDPGAEHVLRATSEFLARDLAHPRGGFRSAVDADTAGHEGAHYVWTREQLVDVLGAEDAEFLAPILGFSGAPFFEGHHYVLHLPAPLEDQAERRHRTRADLVHDIEPLRRKLLEARSLRPAPRIDGKILTDWNGMAIRGLASAGRVLRDEATIARAVAAAEFLDREQRDEGGRLQHVWCAGRSSVPALLGDYVWWARGLLGLFEATGERRWLEVAGADLDEMERRLAEPRGGYAVAGRAPDLLFRSREVFDGAVPAGNAVAVLDFLEMADATGETRWLERAEATLRAFAATAEAQPDAVRTLCVAAGRFARLQSRD